MAPKLVRPSLTRAERQACAEGAFDDFVQAVEDRLGQIVEAHNTLDRKFEDLHYRILFIMERITVKRRREREGLIIGAGESEYEEGTLLEFYAKDGPAYIARLKREVAALEDNLARTDAAADAPGTTLADVEALAAARASRTRH